MTSVTLSRPIPWMRAFDAIATALLVVNRSQCSGCSHTIVSWWVMSTRRWNDHSSRNDGRRHRLLYVCERVCVWMCVFSSLPPAHTLEGSAAKISMQDFLMICRVDEEKVVFFFFFSHWCLALCNKQIFLLEKESSIIIQFHFWTFPTPLKWILQTRRPHQCSAGIRNIVEDVLGVVGAGM